MSSIDGRRAAEDSIPKVKHYEGFGELVTGGTDSVRILFTAMCMVNDPTINQYLLDCKLRLQDRITKTVVFPRNGMALPNGEVYKTSVPEEIVLNVTENSSNES